MYHFYDLVDKNFEYCYNIETKKPLNKREVDILKNILNNNFVSSISQESCLDKKSTVVEVGPRLNFATPFSTNFVDICHACGVDKVVRAERSRRYLLPKKENKKDFIEKNHDRMTECCYLKKLDSFDLKIKKDKVFEVPLIEKGISAIKEINKKMGLGMDEWDEEFYFDLFVNKIKRNPTNVECFQLGQANSEHSRHWFFKGKLNIDGEEVLENLMEIVSSPLKKNPKNSLIAFSDNSSAIKGFEIKTIIPENPGKLSRFQEVNLTYHFIFTAETHNFPSGIAPFPGAETGTGGRIRDIQGTGRGGLVVAGTAGYCVGNLNIPKYKLPWEDSSFVYPENMASPLNIEIKASNGASDYGNKFGEPVIQGYTRSFGLLLPNKERQEWIKPIMFTGGVGQISDKHIKKQEPEKGMLIVQIGGPAYRIGLGGGAASSMIQGENIAELDFDAVQRGDAEMEQKMNRVIRACIEMENNPIISIHDQGAGGPCNVLTEIIELVGGRVEIRKIKSGDKTMSVLEIWGAEYQERNALLVKPEKIKLFQEICEREKCNCEVLGEITGDGKITVHDSEDDSLPVDLELKKIMGKMPQKTFTDKSKEISFQPLSLPKDLKINDALERVLRLLSVGSKRFLTSKVDRSVTGLVVQQQCVGPLQLTVSDVAVIAQSHFSKTGSAISIGEQPVKAVINPSAGARMAVAEALTNIVWAKISKIEDIKCSANWMWAAKLPGETARVYKAAKAMEEMMIEVGVAIDGGKDSLSMATKVKDEVVKSPGELTISAYAPVPDIEKVITPDIKKPGKSSLWFIDLGEGKNRMGGSALAQTFKQVGRESADIEDVTMLKKSFNAVQEMIKKEVVLSGHDRSDGGLITTLLEMAFSGNAGFEINHKKQEEDYIRYYFNEEAGLVLEVSPEKEKEFLEVISNNNLGKITFKIGKTTEEKIIKIKDSKKTIFEEEMIKMRALWESTSFALEKYQTNQEMAKQEQKNIYDQRNPEYVLTFSPEKISKRVKESENKPKVAVLREEGSNGDREMTSAFYSAGFDCWDVTMSDLLNKKINLDDFRGVAFVGGFSYADVLGSSKGWAGTIKFNKELKKVFDDFYNREDTFSLGVCNGCQLMANLGWAPFKEFDEKKQPKFSRNKSERFESRWATVKILESPSVMLKGMEGSVLGIWVAHGEGRIEFPDKKALKEVQDNNLACLAYVDDENKETEKYPFNPNGSVQGINGICSPDGRHLALMPHPERAFLKWQWSWMSEDWKNNLEVSPWFKMFQNAYNWCNKKYEK